MELLIILNVRDRNILIYEMIYERIVDTTIHYRIHWEQFDDTLVSFYPHLYLVVWPAEGP